MRCHSETSILKESVSSNNPLLFFDRCLSHATHAFVTETLKKDIPSGRTPARSNRQYPRSLAQGTPDDLRLERYRAKRNAPPNTPAKFNLDEHLDDADSVVCWGGSKDFEKRYFLSSDPGLKPIFFCFRFLCLPKEGSLLPLEEAQAN